MARSRNIKPALAKNDVLASLGIHAQFLFAMLPTLADKEGRLKDRPERIRIEIFPYDKGDADVDALLDALANCKERFIERYEIDGSRYIQITNFHKHQRPHHNETESDIPPPRVFDNQGAHKEQPRREQGTTKVTSPSSQKKQTKGISVKGIRLKESGIKKEGRSEFDAFWNVVPRKVGKEAARKAYWVAVKKIRGRPPDEGGEDPHGFLLDRMTAFSRSECARGEFCPHPSTWLNQGRYDDDENEWRERKKSEPKPERGTIFGVKA